MVMKNFDETVWTQLHKNGGLTFQDYDQLQKDILSAKTVISKEFYDRHVLGIFDTDKDRHEFLVGGRGCKRMAMMRNEYGEECESPYFLYEETWRGRKVKDMETDHLMNTVMMLKRRALEFKEQFEVYLISSKNSNPVMEPKYELLEIAKMDTQIWLESTPMYKQLMSELKERGLDEYLLIIEERRKKEAENGKKNY